MKIKKAVIPAAGLGTRVLPASKSMPKEMLPIVDKPAIQYIVEEAVKSGIEDILIITSRGKTTVEDHFDRNPELEARLLASKKQEVYDQMVAISHMANIQYVRQKETKGLGHAIWRAKRFVGDEPFAVLLGDDIMRSEKPVIGQLIDAAEKYAASCVGVQEVSTEAIVKYSSVKVEPLGPRTYRVTDMIEKPRPEEIFSHYAILGRYVLTPHIFDILEHLAPGYAGEIQLTDAMCALGKRYGMLACEFEGTRYDLGSKLGFLLANLDIGLEHPETMAELRKYIKAAAARF